MILVYVLCGKTARILKSPLTLYEKDLLPRKMGVTTQPSRRRKVEWSVAHPLLMSILTQRDWWLISIVYAALARLPDKRKARGIRYALVTVLTYLVLAKLSGQDSLSGIADWVRLRKEVLNQAFPLEKLRAPCANTYQNILECVIDMAEFEQVGRTFFAHQPCAGYKPGHRVGWQNVTRCH